MIAKQNDVQSLYQQIVLDHSRSPHNFGRIDDADHQATGHNPLCGDKLTVYLHTAKKRIANIAFEGNGCAISMASASIMTDMLGNESLQAAEETINSVIAQFESPENDEGTLAGDLAALESVRKYPSRIKCALLAWKTTAGALREKSPTITTED